MCRKNDDNNTEINKYMNKAVQFSRVEKEYHAIIIITCTYVYGAFLSIDSMCVFRHVPK